MKKYLIVLLLLFIPLFACKKNYNASTSQGEKKNLSIQQSDLIESAPADADKYTGEVIIVKGKVADVFTSKNGHTFINFDRKYPNHTFTAVKFKDSKVDISGIKPGSIISIKGLIKTYKDKPEIILDSQDQILNIE